MTVLRTLPDAVVFDCDGTIVDTEPISDRTWEVVLERYDYRPTAEDVRAILGRPFQVSHAYWRDRIPGIPAAAEELRAEVREVFRAIFDEEVEFFADVLDVMRELAGEGVPLAVASSSSTEHVERVLDTAGARDLVSVVLGADACEHHKPHPEPYQRAAEGLGVPPDRCSAVEDSQVGIEAARGAGMWTVAMLRPNVPPDDLAQADLVVETLELSHLVRPRRVAP